MSLKQIFKKVLIPCVAGVANTSSKEGHTYGPNCGKKGTDQGTKPSDLPIYSKECIVCRKADQVPPPPSGMEETVGNIRRELWVWQDNLKGYRHKIIDVYRKGFSKADSAITYLREPAQGRRRIGAIALSGLAGYILGMRRGKIRSIFYGTLGAAGMAAVCYPDEAADYLETVVLEGRKYFIVAYHFFYGETPKLPEWLEKFLAPAGQQEGEPPTNKTDLELPKELTKEKKT